MRTALAALLLVLAGVAAAVLLTHRRHDVVGSPSVEFVTTDVPTAPPPRARQAPSVAWGTYGYDARRLRAPQGIRLAPPFRVRWTFHGRSLLEFPPAVAYGRVYLPTFDGRFYALDAATGRVVWRFTSYRCSWASPAVARGLVYETFLSHRPDCSSRARDEAGEVVAFRAATGAVAWLRKLPVTESSPLVAGGLVYVGDWSGRVTALDARTGRTRWSFRTGGPVKASAALAHGTLVVGAYDGRVYGLDARSGRLRWRGSAQAGLRGRGAFYSSAALAYGRAFLGSTDGAVYAFGLRDGRLLWARRTGGYVYASPAVWRGLVLVGSYDGDFYALDAATGAVRWRFPAGGRISGAATVLDGVVYFSTFAGRTYGLDAASGRPRFRFPDGKYSPVVADARRVYLVGEGRLYALSPR